MKSDLFVSVVLILDQSIAENRKVLQLIQSELDTYYSDYEVVVVGQGTYASFTEQDESVLEHIPSLRYIQLTTWVHQDVAWAAALENVIGDFVVMFNPTEDPIEVISEVVTICKSGFDVVVGAARQARSFGYKIFRSMGGYVLKLVGYSLPRNATGLRCLSRRAVNSVTSTGRLHHQLSMRIQKSDYPQTAYNYTLLSTMPRSLATGIRDILRLIVFNSPKPLRWMSTLGLIGSFSAFLFAMYSLLVHLVKGDVIEGWTTTIIFMSSLFMVQFIMMAFFGEYLGRLLDERSEQADYSVVFEKHSAVMVNQDRVNVLHNALNLDENNVQTGRNS